MVPLLDMSIRIGILVLVFVQVGRQVAVLDGGLVRQMLGSPLVHRPYSRVGQLSFPTQRFCPGDGADNQEGGDYLGAGWFVSASYV